MGPNHKEASGPLAKLDTPDTVPSYKFPAELDMIPHTVTFRAFKTTQLDRSSSANKVSLTNISLPVPANLSTAYNLDYGTESLGAIWQSLVDIGADNKYGEAARAGFNLSEESLKAGAAGASIAAILRAGGFDFAKRTGQGLIASVLVPPLQLKAALGNFGLGVNPHTVVLFNAPNLRRHEFSYQFTPMSYAEAKTLKDIIHKFKYHAAPGYPQKVAGGNEKTNLAKAKTVVNNVASELDTSTGKHFYEYPEYFEIEFADEDKAHLFKIGNSFLEAFSVDYHPGNTPSYAWGGEKGEDVFTPTQINIKMTFLETDVVTKDNIMKENR